MPWWIPVCILAGVGLFSFACTSSMSSWMNGGTGIGVKQLHHFYRRRPGLLSGAHHF